MPEGFFQGFGNSETNFLYIYIYIYMYIVLRRRSVRTLSASSYALGGLQRGEMRMAPPSHPKQKHFKTSLTAWESLLVLFLYLGIFIQGPSLREPARYLRFCCLCWGFARFETVTSMLLRRDASCRVICLFTLVVFPRSIIARAGTSSPLFCFV